jgi:hypothetical protein
MKPLIFDRETERDAMIGFLRSKTETTMLVTGDSGVGKSFIIEHCLNLELPESYLQYSFKSNEFGEIFTLSNAIDKAYQMNRSAARFFAPLKHHVEKYLGFRIEFNGAIVPTTAGSLFLGMSRRSALHDPEYIDQLVLELENAGIKALYISNIEMIIEKEDKYLLNLLFKNKKSNLKMIFEIGSLTKRMVDGRVWAADFPDTDRSICVARFDKRQSEQFYMQLNGESPPVDIYSSTGGIALLLSHSEYAIERISGYELINAKLQSLNMVELEVLEYLHILGGSAEMEHISLYVQIAESTLLSHISRLHTQYLIEFVSKKIMFSNPMIYKYFSSPSRTPIAKRYRAKMIEKHESLKEIRFEDRVIIIVQASYIDDPKPIVRHLREAVYIGFRERQFSQICNLMEIAMPYLSNWNAGDLMRIYVQSLVLGGEFQKAMTLCTDYESLLRDGLSEQEIYIPDVILSQCLFETYSISQSIHQLLDKIVDMPTWLQAISLGQLSACFVFRGNFVKAQDAYFTSVAIAESNGHTQIRNELRRLCPQFMEAHLAVVELNEFLESADAQAEPLLASKCLHNRALCQLDLHNEIGARKDFELALKYFEETFSPFRSLSLIGLSLCDIIEGNYNPARDRLNDARNIAEYSYERFATLCNLAFLDVEDGKIDSAFELLNRAEQILSMESNPLNDPNFWADLHYNRSLLLAMNGEFDSARLEYAKIRVPETYSARRYSEGNFSALHENILQRSKANLWRYAEPICQKSWENLRYHLIEINFFDFTVPTIGYNL